MGDTSVDDGGLTTELFALFWDSVLEVRVEPNQEDLEAMVLAMADSEDDLSAEQQEGLRTVWLLRQEGEVVQTILDDELP